MPMCPVTNARIVRWSLYDQLPGVSWASGDGHSLGGCVSVRMPRLSLRLARVHRSDSEDQGMRRFEYHVPEDDPMIVIAERMEAIAFDLECLVEIEHERHVEMGGEAVR